MSQVETTQTRPQSGRQNSPAGANGDQKRGPKRQGSGNRQFDDNTKPRTPTGDRPAGGRGRGGPRVDKPYVNNKDSKTIYIGKVFTDDLDGSVISEKLKDQRIKYLRDVLEQFGAIDSFEAPSGEGYVLLSYETHQSADNALKALKDYDKVEGLLDRVQDKIIQSKLPAAITPNLHKYRYSWSDKQAPARTSRTGAKTVNAQAPKTVVATKKPIDANASPATPQPTQPAQPQQTQQSKPKKERKPKQEEQTQQPEQTETQQPQQTQQQQPKQKKNVQQQPQQTVLSPKTQQGADDLQREAERARLSQDLVYLRQQQQHVSQELSAESDRCRARDERITRLSDELNRFRQQEQFLEGQLKAEQKWKTDAEERISKLTEEINHFVQEQKQVEKRLSTVEQQLGASQ